AWIRSQHRPCLKSMESTCSGRVLGRTLEKCCAAPRPCHTPNPGLHPSGFLHSFDFFDSFDFPACGGTNRRRVRKPEAATYTESDPPPALPGGFHFCGDFPP